MLRPLFLLLLLSGSGASPALASEFGCQQEHLSADERARLEAIGQLETLLSGRREGEFRAELMLRLADLYFLQARHVSMSPTCDTSREWADKSIVLYQAILADYPQYSRADEAMFYLAAALYDLDRKEEANAQFSNLVRQYPDSARVPDAWVAIGEYWFEDEGQIYKALLSYKNATTWPDSDLYPFAMYKLAWCYYILGEYPPAIDLMKEVVEMSDTAPQKPGANDLKEMAIKELFRFYSDAGQSKEADVYFTSIGRQDVLAKLRARRLLPRATPASGR